MTKIIAKFLLKAISALLLVLCIALLGLFVWLYTGERSLPIVANYVKSNVAELLPETIRFDISDVLASLDSGFRIRFQLMDLSIMDPMRGEFKTSSLSIVLNAIDLLDINNHGFLNIEIDNPGLLLSNIDHNVNTTPLSLAEINDYITTHRSQLLKFSFALSNMSITLNPIDNKKSTVLIKKLTLRPHILHNELIFNLVGDFAIGGKETSIHATLDTGSKTHIGFHGAVEDVSYEVVRELGLELPPLEGSDIKMDFVFNALMRGSKSVEYIEFEAVSGNAVLKENEFFGRDIQVDAFNLKGYCTSNCSDVVIEKFLLKTGDLHIRASGDLKPMSEPKMLVADFVIDPLPVESVPYYWPKPLVTSAREWVSQNIRGGVVQDAKGHLELNLSDIATKGLDSSKVAIKLSVHDTNVRYLEHVDPATKVNGTVSISQDDVRFQVADAALSGVRVTGVSGIIKDPDSDNGSVTVEAEVAGDAGRVVDIAYKHAKEENTDLRTLTGNTTGHIKLVIPLRDEDITVKDVMIKATAKIKDAKAGSLYKDVGFDNGDFELNVDNGLLNVQGRARIAGKFLSDVLINYNFLRSSKVVEVKAKLDWRDLTHFGIQPPSFCEKSFVASLIMEDVDSHSVKRIALDMKDSNIKLPWGGNKKPGEAGTASFTLEHGMQNKADSYIVKQYALKVGALESSGSLLMDKNFDLIKLNSPHTKFGEGEFAFDWERTGENYKIRISGASFDATQISSEALRTKNAEHEVKSAYEVTMQVQKLHLKNQQVMHHPVFRLTTSNSSIQQLDLSGNMGGDSYAKLEIRNGNITLSSNDAGKLIKGLGISANVEGGAANFVGKMKPDNDFEGTLLIENYRMRKAPLMIKVVSVVSITTTSLEGFSNLLTNRGVMFNKLKCPMNFKDGVLYLENCYTRGPSLTFTASGKIDYNADEMHIQGSVIPENILNIAVRNIPIIGNAFKERENHALIGASYKIQGPIDDPVASSNPLSILAPGILKEIFN